MRIALQGEKPPIARLLSLHSLLTGCTTELRQPINLEQQLLDSQGADSEVAASMVQLLQVPPSQIHALEHQTYVIKCCALKNLTRLLLCMLHL